MKLPRYSLRNMLLAVTAIAILLAMYRSGSILAFVVMLVFILAAVVASSVAVFRGVPHRRPFFAAFAVVGWIGITITLSTRFPISGVNIVRSMWWLLKDSPSAWLQYFPSSVLGITYLCATLFCALVCGVLIHAYTRICAKLTK